MSDTVSDIATVAAAEEAAASAVRAAETVAREETGEIVADIVEAAQERVEAAQDMAAEITRAAMETELGRQIADNNRRISEWLDGEGQRLQAAVTTLQAELAQVRETLAATATLALTSQDTQQSTPPLSTEQPLTEAVETVTEVLPETVTSPAESIPAEPAPKRRKLFL